MKGEVKSSGGRWPRRRGHPELKICQAAFFLGTTCGFAADWAAWCTMV